MTPTGYVAYNTDVSYSTTTTAQVVTSTSVNGVIGIPVVDASSFGPYQNLTVQTANGPISIFCKGAGGPSLGLCSSPSTHSTIPSGALVTTATFSTFDVYSIIPGGKAVVKPTSVTVLTDAPAADRALPTYVGANASFGLVKLTPSATITGKFQLTFGYCTTATTYSAADPTCHTGVLKYGPAFGSTFGFETTVRGVTEDVYATIGTYPEAPGIVTQGSSFHVLPGTALGAGPASAEPPQHRRGHGQQCEELHVGRADPGGLDVRERVTDGR